MNAAPQKPHRVVIVGAGFGGLEAAYRLAGAPVSITLIDRRNHHLFQPLLYQVATASLATSEIAWPIRYLLRDRPEVTTLFATVNGVDAAAKRVLLDDGDTVPYDTLVLATGARHAYFGHDEWEPFAPGLKTLEDATTLRRRILVAFERAERETDPERRAALLTFVIVGAGPTGVELAGTIAELAQRHAAARLPPHRHPQRARRADRGRPARAGRLCRRSLGLCAALAGKLGVEVMLGQAVTECPPTASSMAATGSTARTLIWAAGVRASPAAEWLDAPADRAGRLQVEPDLTVPGHPDIFAIGDTVADQGLRRQAGARHRAGRQAAGPLCRRRHQGAAARRDARRRSATSTPAAWRRSASARR